MARMEVLSGSRTSESAEIAKLHRGVRQYDLDMHKFRGIRHRIGMYGCGRHYANPANQLSDEQLAQRVGATLGKLVEPKAKSKGPRGIFTGQTESILRAACNQYLGYYPTQTPCKSEIKAILKEMARMHAQRWEGGIECMEHQFQGTENAIREIRKYAKEQEIKLPTI